MPSANAPTVVVKPGPGRLPAGTAPASALITPPGGGGSSAALDAHIIDPVDAHQATAIGQAGFTGETLSVAAATLGAGLQELTNFVNVRETWVLDANPANTADFSGASALITAVPLAQASGARPMLYLRPGTYNWTDVGPFDGLTVIGSAEGTTIIQNGAGDLRPGTTSVFENLTIDVTGDLQFSGGTGGCVFKKVTLTVATQVEIAAVSEKNVFERVTANGNFFNVQGVNNQFRNMTGGQFNLAATAVRTIIDNWVVGTGALKSNAAALTMSATTPDCVFNNILLEGTPIAGWTADALFFTGSGHKISNVVVDAPVMGNLTPVTINGSSITADGIHIKGISGNFAPLFIQGTSATNCVTSNISLSNIDAQGGNYTTFDGLSNRVDGVFFDTITNPVNGTDALFVTGDSNTITNIRFNVMTGYDGTLFEILGQNQHISGVELDTLITPGPAFKFMRVRCDNSSVNNVRIRSIADFTGLTSNSLFDFFGADHVTLSHIYLISLGATAPIPVPIFAFSSASIFPVLDQVWLNSVECSSATGIISLDTANVDSLTLSDINFSAVTGVGPAVRVTGVTAQLDNTVRILQSNFSLTGATNPTLDIASVGANVHLTDVHSLSAIAGEPALKVINSRSVLATNCVFEGAAGNALISESSGAIYDICKFVGGTTGAGSGTQLIQGDGYSGATYDSFPFVLRNCEAVLNTANMDASNAGAVSAVIELGSGGGSGSVMVDGFHCLVADAVVNLHRDDLIVINVPSLPNNPGIYPEIKNITIDLNEKTWTNTGLSRGFFSTSAAVLKLNGDMVGSNLAVINVKESDISDDRYVVWANGVRIKGLLIDGPDATEVHGTGSSIKPALSLTGGELEGLNLYPNEGLDNWGVGAADGVVEVYQSRVNGGDCNVSACAGNLVGGYESLFYFSETLVTGFEVSSNLLQASSVTHALVAVHTDSSLVNCKITGAAAWDTSFIAPLVRLDSGSIHSSKIFDNASAINPPSISIDGSGVQVLGNTIKGVGGHCSISCAVTLADGAVISNNRVQLNAVSDNALNAIYFNDAERVVISGNQCKNLGSTTGGCLISGSGLNASITGNVVEGDNDSTLRVGINATGANSVAVGNQALNDGTAAAVLVPDTAGNFLTP